MKSWQQVLTLNAFTAVLISLYGSCAAAEEEDEVTRLITPSSNLSLGIGHWSGERDQFGIYDDQRGGDTMILMDGEINTRDNTTGTWVTGKFRNLGIDNRDAELRYDQQGNWGIGINYDEIPRIAPYTVNTGMTGLGGTTQSVPLSADPESDPTAYVPGTGTDVILGTKRKGTEMNFNKYLTPRLNFKVNFKNEEKDGNRHWGRGGQPEFAAEPIDSTIQEMQTVLDYADKHFQMSGGYIGNWYQNHNTLVTTLRGNNPTTAYYLSLPLDNQAHQLFVNGGYNFTPTMRGTFRVSYSHATQDEHIPTADIPDLTASVSPTSLDGKIDTTLLQLGLSARPTSDLSLVANIRYHKVDEKTPTWLVVDTASTQVHSTPLGYETTSGKLEATYRLPAGYSLIGGVEYSQQDRVVPFGSDTDLDGLDDERYVPFRADLNETTYRIQLRKTLSESLNGSMAFLHSERDGSTYEPAIHSEGGINPINISDRDRNKWRLTLDWVPTDNLGLQFNFEDSQDDYGPDTNPYGLLEGSARLYSLDADYAFNQDWRLLAWVSLDETKAEQFNGRWDRITDNHEIDRYSNLKETGTSFGLGINGKASEKVKLGADVQWTRSKAEYHDVVIPIGENGDPDIGYPTGLTPLPDIQNTATKINLFTEYALNKNSDLRLELIHERWKTNDWTWQFSDGSSFIYGTSSDGTMVIQDPNQNATFVGLRYKQRFQ